MNMNTNFDKWKEQLTPEEFVRVSSQWCGNFPFCDECGKNGECMMMFYEWANAPADKVPRLRRPEKCPQCGHPSRFQGVFYGQNVFFCPGHGAFWCRIGEANAPAKEEK